MLKRVLLISLVLITAFLTYSEWTRNALIVLDANHPKPRGEMSRTDYMNQVCHVSTNKRLKGEFSKYKINLETYCGCFSDKVVQMKSPADDHPVALGFHAKQVIDQRIYDAGVDSQTGEPLPRDSFYSTRLAYEKEYGLSVPKQISFYRKTYPIEQSCIQEIEYAINNGQFIDGDVAEGVKIGKDVFMWESGNRYEGDFLGGKRTGNGVYIWPGGDRYEGDFIAGAATGKGVWTSSMGYRYEGDFVAGKRTGKGVATWARDKGYKGNFARYEGDFVADKYMGEGKVTWANGNSYEGDFVDGKSTGNGRYTWPDGSQYTVEHNAEDGASKGVFILANGSRHEDETGDGVRISKSEFILANGDRYKGVSIGDELTGKGVLTAFNGAWRFEGDFIDGKLSGLGKKIWSHGTSQEGRYVDGLYRGKATSTDNTSSERSIAKSSALHSSRENR